LEAFLGDWKITGSPSEPPLICARCHGVETGTGSCCWLRLRDWALGHRTAAHADFDGQQL